MPKKGNNIYKRKDGRWEGRLYNSSSRKYRSVYGSSYSQVRQKLAELAQNEAKPSAAARLTISEILDNWLDARADIKPSSLYSYQSKIKRHILPYFKKRSYGKLTASDLEKFKTAKLAEGFSEKYVADMVMMIKSATKYSAKNYGYADPFAYVSLPKVHKTESKLLNKDEQVRFISACRDSGLAGLGCFLSLFAGLRIGEICALKWENITPSCDMLSVRATVQRMSDESGKSRVMLLPPKTDTSYRDIPMPGFIAEVLKKYRQDDDVFIVSGTSKPVEPRTLTNRFKAILQKAQLPAVKFHSLRHAFATNFLRQTGDIKSLSEILGHANVSITLRIYVHSSYEQKLACMEKLEKLL